MKRAREREAEAWAELYDLFSASLYSFLYHKVRNREVAEDLLASVFVDAIEDISKFRGEISDFRSWLFAIARNNSTDYFRKLRRAEVKPLETVDAGEVERVSGGVDPESEAISNIERAKLLAAVADLSPDQQEVILLRLLAGMTSPEIARLTGRTVGAVKALQHRAVGVLARALQGNLEP